MLRVPQPMEFHFLPSPASSVSAAALSAGWASHSFVLEAPIAYDVRMEYISRIPTLSADYDTTTGWIDKIDVSWIEGHPFTTWIMEHFPEEYDTISDFELLFGDRDRDGITNYLEFATFSSPNSAAINFWVTVRSRLKLKLRAEGVHSRPVLILRPDIGVKIEPFSISRHRTFKELIFTMNYISARICLSGIPS